MFLKDFFPENLVAYICYKIEIACWVAERQDWHSMCPNSVTAVKLYLWWKHKHGHSDHYTFRRVWVFEHKYESCLCICLRVYRIWMACKLISDNNNLDLIASNSIASTAVMRNRLNRSTFPSNNNPLQFQHPNVYVPRRYLDGDAIDYGKFRLSALWLRRFHCKVD